MTEQSMVSEFFALFYSDSFLMVFKVTYWAMPYWLPVVLLITFWNLWIRYRRKRFILNQEMVLLEIILPAEIKRSPKAMEQVFSAIHAGPNETTWFDVLFLGKVRPWWSFEIVSTEGNIHFYIWTRAFFRNIIESAIYGQYPEVEIYEAKEDYSRQIKLVKDETRMWGTDFRLTELDAYPIKTYVDYGLDKENVKDEEKVDPMASFLEYFASIGKGEHLWMQVIIKQTKDSDKVHRKYPSWKVEAEREIERLRKEALPKNVPEGQPIFPNPTPGQKDKITAIERSINKHGFDCGVRGLYIADAEAFQAHNIPGIITSLKHYSSNNLNGLDITRVTDFNYPWQDYKGIREDYEGRKKLEAYRKRSWFHAPYRYKSYVLNTEELATIYHFPGAAAQAPGLHRLSSKRSDAPINLPT